MKFLLSILSFLLLNNLSIQGQNTWNWLKSDPEKSKVFHVYFVDNWERKNYHESAKYLEWLLDSVPDLNKSLYIRGLEVYEALEKTAADSITQIYFQDQIFKLLDQRQKYFNDSAIVYRYVGSYTTKTVEEIKLKYKVKFKRASYWERYQYYGDLVDDHHEQLSRMRLLHFIHSSQKVLENGEIDYSRFKQDVELVTQIVEKKIELAHDQSKWMNLKDKVEKLFKETKID